MQWVVAVQPVDLVAEVGELLRRRDREPGAAGDDRVARDVGREVRGNLVRRVRAALVGRLTQGNRRGVGGLGRALDRHEVVVALPLAVPLVVENVAGSGGRDARRCERDPGGLANRHDAVCGRGVRRYG